MLLEQGDLLLDAEFPCKEEIYVYTRCIADCNVQQNVIMQNQTQGIQAKSRAKESDENYHLPLFLYTYMYI